VSRKSRIPRSSRRPSHSRGGTILGVFVGMILGAIIVTAAVLFFNRSDNPFSQVSSTKQPTGTPAATTQPTTGTPTGMGTPAAPNAVTTQPGAVTPLPGKPGDRPVEKPNYTFFNTLPSGENTPVTPPAPVGQTQSVTPSAQVSPEKQMYLQLAAFENAEQADDLKARLLLMGLDRIVTQRAQLSDGRVVHRIRIGPFSDREDLKAMRARLVSSGFSADEVSN